MESLLPPKIFSAKRQRIFEFVWENPGVTRREIVDKFYTRSLTGPETVTVHMSMIRAGLAEATPFELVSHKVPNDPRMRAYKIIKRNAKCQPQLPA